MYQLPDIVTALPHPHEPPLRNRPQLDGFIVQPKVDSRVAFYGSGEPEDVQLTAQAVEIQRNATRSVFAHKASDGPERRASHSASRVHPQRSCQAA
jgi:hypothetical protein